MIWYVVIAFLTFMFVRFGLNRMSFIPIDIDMMAFLAGMFWPITIGYALYSYYAE